MPIEVEVTYSTTKGHARNAMYRMRFTRRGLTSIIYAVYDLPKGANVNTPHVPRLSSTKVLTRIKPTMPSGGHRLAPALMTVAFAAAAHAQGTIDFSGANTLLGNFKTFAIFAGAVIAFGSLIFAGIRMMGGRFNEAVPGLFGALFGAAVLGWGAGWINSLTGQSIP